MVEQLVERITNGEWATGTQIPSENELAVTMIVSRISVCNALQRLIAWGMIESRVGEGTFVKNSGTEELAGPLIRVTLSGNRSMEELLQFRRRVEFVGTEEAAKRATENDVLRLESLIEQMKESVNHQNYDQYEYIDCAFHLALVETSGFNLLVSMMWVLWEILDCYFDGRKMKWDLDKCYIKHYSVYEAVKQHDPIQVAATINENIRDLLLLVEAERGS